MAGISTTIQLYDRVTATLNKIQRGLDDTNAAFTDLEDKFGKGLDPTTAQAVRKALAGASGEVAKLKDKIEESANEQRRYTEEAQRFHSAISALLGPVGLLATMAGAAFGGTKLVEMSDNIANTKARLDLMNESYNKANGTMMQTEDLYRHIYASANDARGSIQSMADMVSKLGNNAGDAFANQQEIIDFAALIQKQFKISGTSGEEASAAMLQLTQALASGVLRGDELRSIFEQAPSIVQTIADYLDVPLGKIRDMAADGQITADVVKKAMLNASDDINARFEKIPMTWGDIWTRAGNDAIIALQPLLEEINNMANQEWVMGIVEGIVTALGLMAMAGAEVLETVNNIGTAIADNWSWLGPIILGVASALGVYAFYLGLVRMAELWTAASTGVLTFAKMAAVPVIALLSGATMAETAAQMGLNAALYACPLVWIIMLIIILIALFYGAVAAVNHFAGTSISATGLIAGAFMTVLAFVGNLFVAFYNLVVDVFVTIYNLVADVANFIGNVFTDPINAICRLFFGLADTVLGVLQALASAIDAIFGSDLASSVQGWRDSLGGWVDETFGEGEKVMEKMDAQSMHLGRFEYGDAFDLGYNFGQGVENKLGDLLNGALGAAGNADLPGASSNGGANNGAAALSDIGGYGSLPGNIADTAANTGKMADSLDVTAEDLKYLRDIAERDAINRFTTAEIKVEMTNNNTVSGDMDLDGIVDYLATGVAVAMSKAAEGVYA